MTTIPKVILNNKEIETLLSTKKIAKEYCRSFAPEQCSSGYCPLNRSEGNCLLDDFTTTIRLIIGDEKYYQ